MFCLFCFIVFLRFSKELQIKDWFVIVSFLDWLGFVWSCWKRVSCSLNQPRTCYVTRVGTQSLVLPEEGLCHGAPVPLDIRALLLISPVSSSQVLGLKVYDITPNFTVLEMELMALCMLGKHSTDWATALAPRSHSETWCLLTFLGHLPRRKNCRINLREGWKDLEPVSVPSRTLSRIAQADSWAIEVCRPPGFEDFLTSPSLCFSAPKEALGYELLFL